MGVLFVSHRSEEVLALTDTITVFRDGVVVADRSTTDFDEQNLVKAILGFSLEHFYPEPHHTTQDLVLTVTDLTGPMVDGFSASVHHGEILGLTGLLGMGHDLVPHLIFGSIAATGGAIEIGGAVYSAVGMTPRRAMDVGLALLPSNRLREGGVAGASVAENVTLAILDRFHVRGLLRRRREEQTAERMMADFKVEPVAAGLPLGTFSGGNQQRALSPSGSLPNPAFCYSTNPPTAWTWARRSRSSNISETALRVARVSLLRQSKQRILPRSVIVSLFSATVG